MGQRKDLFIIKSNWLQKVFAIVCFALLMAAMLIAHQYPVTGWELDIYASTPILTWIFISLAMLGGISIIISQVIKKGFEINKTWIWGVLILVIGNVTILFIPYIRNYYTWGGDNLTHWGFVKDIVTNGHFTVSDFYPLTHIILAEIRLITNAPLQLVANLSTPLLYTFFIFSTYLLSTVILPKHEQQLLATAISAIVFMEVGFSYFLTPNGWSIFLLPLFFFFYFKIQSDRLYIIPFLSLLIMYPFFHPLSSLMIAVIMIALYVIKLSFKALRNNTSNTTLFAKPEWTLFFGIAELVILVPWIWASGQFRANISGIAENFFSRTDQALENMGTALSKVQINGFAVAALYIKLYGADTILIILSLFGILLSIGKIRKMHRDSSLFFIVDIGFMFLFFSLIYFLYLFGLFGLNNIAAERMIFYIMIFTPELAAISIIWIIPKFKYKFLKYVFILILLTIPSWFSIRALYYSPYNIQPNAQVTNQDVAGFKWMITEKDLTIGILNVANPPSRFFDAILGVNLANQRSDNIDVQFADHFGYNEFSTLGAQYSGDKYACITESDKMTYSTVWKAVGRFDDSDFAKLDNDDTVNKLYSNGNMEVYYIRGNWNG